MLFLGVKVLPYVLYIFLYIQNCCYRRADSLCPLPACPFRCCLWIPWAESKTGECMQDFVWVTCTPFLHLSSV